MSENFDLLKAVSQNQQELSRTIEVRPGVEVDVKFLGKKAWRKLNKRLQAVKGSKVAQDEAAFNATHSELAKAVTGWRGMTREAVLEFLPVDPAALPDQIPFDPKNVLALLLHSGEFFSIIAEAVDDLGAFRETSEEEARGN